MAGKQRRGAQQLALEQDAAPRAGRDAPGGLSDAAALFGNAFMAEQVQRKAGGQGGGDVPSAAAAGVAGGGGQLPHYDTIQAAFGAHDVGGVSAHTGGDAAGACASMGAAAYATGDQVAFAGAPDLHTAAHEAAHVVQQRAGVQLKGGVGEAGDAYEQHADQVADAVVRGESAEALLGDPAASGGGAGVQRVQMKEEGEVGGASGIPVTLPTTGLQSARFAIYLYSALWGAESEEEIEEITPEQLSQYENEVVEVCSDPFFAGTEHWWIKVGDREVGMNPSNDPLAGVLTTEITDHGERSEGENANCTPAGERDPRWDDADPACVVESSPVGKPTGPYADPREGEMNLGPDGVVYHCQAVVAEILDKCSTTCRVEDEGADR